MSLQKLDVNKILQKIVKSNGYFSFVQCYSRRSDSKVSNVNYKVVKSENVLQDAMPQQSVLDANWELLAPRGYRFFMPGSVGAAFQGTGSMWPPTKDALKSLVDFDGTSQHGLTVTSYECPVVLRKSLMELFPGSEVETCASLSVVTLSQKPGEAIINDLEVEHTAKSFVFAAKEICSRLALAGYWADFINPFSGRPCISAFHNAKLYNTDERFRCLGFTINEGTTCTIVSAGKKKAFKGSLFTDAPAKSEVLQEILDIYDE